TIATKNNYNRYIKKYPVEKIFALLLYHQYVGMHCGRSILLQLKYLVANEHSIPSQGELSKKLSFRLPMKLWEMIYNDVVHMARTSKNKRVKNVNRMLKIIDSSLLTATATMKWARHRKHKNGLKLHMILESSCIPGAFRLTEGRCSDRKSLKWAITRGYTYIFDRGYNDYSMFYWIGQQGASFVTRAWSNIQYIVVRKRRVGKRQKEKGILSDSIIEVIKERTTGHTAVFRMIVFTFVDSNRRRQTFTLLTNIHDLPSDRIAELYRQRWNIEIAFYWIKTFLKVNHWLSRSPQGVMM
ncbi:MAG: IS4 family transposase, partial [Spirochaetes bacterium]|nr:IS4 family transposase [Spirochaetota bacterium]